MAQTTKNMLGQQPWMARPAVAPVLSALGAPLLDVRFVGGCVRDAVLGLDVGEIDLATPERPERVTARLADAGLRAVPTGLSHGTITTVVDGVSFEITTLRRDTACDGRHADVEFTADWHEDSRRRDFTINAMSLRPDGMLFDDHGGSGDAKAGRVRFVGDAANRIQEDYLRILRLFRFLAWYGREPLDEATLAACRAHAGELQSLSAERVQQELAKLLAAPRPAEAVTMMHRCGVWQVLLPEVKEPSALGVLTDLEREAPAVPPDWLRRLALLVPASAAVGVARRLKLSNASRDRLIALTKTDPDINKSPDKKMLKRRLHKLGAPLVVDRVLLAWARGQLRGESDAATWRGMIEAAEVWKPRRLPVTGDDVVAFGVTPGPEVGQNLAEIEDYWINAEFNMPRENLLTELRRRTDSGK